MKISYLEFYAGPKARQWISQNGLQAEDIGTVVGAAGGVKALALQGLDQFIFGSWLRDNQFVKRGLPSKRLLVGASVGSWRFAAACTENPKVNLEIFAKQYLCGMDFSPNWSPEDVADIFSSKINGILGGMTYGQCSESDVRQVIGNDRYDLAFVVSEAIGQSVARGGMKPSMTGFLLAGMMNAAGRDNLGKFFRRRVFCSKNETKAWLSIPFDGIGTLTEDLNEGNLIDVLKGSARLPFILSPLNEIDGVGKGLFVDGGITDINVGFPFHKREGITLFPHFNPDLRSGWFDRFAEKVRLGSVIPEGFLDNVLMICPSQKWVSSLKDKRVPTRHDLKRFGKDTKSREAAWGDCVERSFDLAVELRDFLGCQDISKIKPISECRAPKSKFAL